jgi:hypothetical protein
MAEALAAFGLASNIVQFVDFGMKLILQGRELYSSAEGVSEENTSIEKIAVDINHMTQNLATGGTIYDEALEVLVKECTRLSHDLLAVLDTLKIDAEKNRRIEAVKKSLKSFRKKREIKDVYDRLCKTRDQVCSHLNFLLT